MDYINTSSRPIGISKSRTRVLLQPGEKIEMTPQDLIDTGLNNAYLMADVAPAPAVKKVEVPAWVQPKVETLEELAKKDWSKPDVAVVAEPVSAPVVETPVVETPAPVVEETKVLSKKERKAAEKAAAEAAKAAEPVVETPAVVEEPVAEEAVVEAVAEEAAAAPVADESIADE